MSALTIIGGANAPTLMLGIGLVPGPVASQRIIELNAENGIVEVRLGGFVMTTRSASRPRHSVGAFNF